MWEDVFICSQYVNKRQQVTKHESLVELPYASDSTDPLPFFFFKFLCLFHSFMYLFVTFYFAEFAAGSRYFSVWYFRSTFVITCSWQSKIGIKALLKLWWYPGCSIYLKSYIETLCKFKVTLCAMGDSWAHHIPWHRLKLGLDAFASQGKNMLLQLNSTLIFKKKQTTKYSAAGRDTVPCVYQKCD